jgi:glutathione S-transferase
MSTIKLYRHALSGHSHRAQLLLSLLGLDAKLVDVELAAGEHKQAAFLAKNRFGQLPLLEDGDIVIADSNAILVYLAWLLSSGQHFSFAKKCDVQQGGNGKQYQPE